MGIYKSQFLCVCFGFEGFEVNTSMSIYALYTSLSI